MSDPEQPPQAAASDDERARAAEAARAKAEAAARAKAEREAAEAAKPPWERDPATPQWLDAGDDALVVGLRERHGEDLVRARSLAGDLALDIRREAIREVAASLKALGYTLLLDVCGVDYPARQPRFEVVYHVYSFAENRRLRLRVTTDETTEVPSVTGVWRAANWSEREVYDMFGVRFAGHPDMTRILLWEGFNGHPLRKDFPVEGVDTGSAIYPEYYEPEAGPVAGTGTGWKPAAAPGEPTEERS